MADSQRPASDAGSPRLRPGFTLPEILVALVLTAMVALMARQIADQLADAGSRLRSASDAASREADTERTLRALLGSYDENADQHAVQQPPFEGNALAMRFRSWCSLPTEGSEPCDVALVIEPSDSSTTLRAEITTAGGRRVLPLGGVEADAAFRYLEDAASGGAWSDGWPVGALAPLAVRVPFGRDTLLVRIGERG